jgi:hypothetical protein
MEAYLEACLSIHVFHLKSNILVVMKIWCWGLHWKLSGEFRICYCRSTAILIYMKPKSKCIGLEKSLPYKYWHIVYFILIRVWSTAGRGTQFAVRETRGVSQRDLRRYLETEGRGRDSRNVDALRVGTMKVLYIYYYGRRWGSVRTTYEQRMVINWEIWENVCIELDVNGRIKSEVYNCKWMRNNFN